MQSNDSDLMSLDLVKRAPRSLRKWFETCVVLLGLLGGGFSLGLWAGIQQGREDRVAEIDRLRQAYDNRLFSLSGRVTAAADTAQSAAATAGEAASTAQSAAQTANQVAKTAAKEAKKP